MTIHKAASLLLAAGLAASTAVVSADEQNVDVAQMQAAIASFGVPEQVSSKAAAAAAEEIANKKRDSAEQSNATVSLVPDDLLDISPY